MLTLKQCLPLMAALIVSLETTEASAQFRTRGQPLIVRFSGMLQPFDEKAAGNLNTRTISYQNRQWLFRVERVNKEE